MRKIDKAVEIIRGWSDEELKAFIRKSEWCPCYYGLNGDTWSCNRNCEDCWNEEVEE